MCRILFWNLKKKSVANLVCDLASATQAEVIILNESATPPEEMLEVLKERITDAFFTPTGSTDRFQCFCRTASYDLSEIHTGSRTSYRKLNLGRKNALLGLVHGIDVRNYDADARQEFAHLLGVEIRFIKSEHENNNLVVMGDFNMNPYDRGMNLASGLNSMMTRTCVQREKRQYLGEDYELFYNPMWSLFGDGNNEPAGTIYDASSQGSYGWNMFDQVLINQSMVSEFQSVKILSSAGAHSLLDNNGRPDAKVGSDHLPILVNFKTT